MKVLKKKKVSNILSLTPVQEGLLFHYLKAPQDELYFEQLCLELKGKVDVPRFKKAWDRVVDDNEMLRVFFRWQKLNQPTQAILKEHPVTPVLYDLTGTGDEAARLKELERLTQEDRGKIFNLHEVPFRVTLIKTAEQRHRLILSNHHIIYDGWSTGIILEEFFQAYQVLSRGEQLPALPPKPSYKEFVKWHLQQDKDSQQAFWQKYLDGFETRTELPVKRKRHNPNEGVTSAEKVNASPGNRFKDKLDNFIKKHQVTIAAFFFSAWGILLQRYCDSSDIAFGTTVSGRPAPIKGIEKMVGLFINTIPLRLKKGTGTNGVNGEAETVTDILKKINRVLMDRVPYENTPLVDINRYSQLGSGEELFDSLVAVENYPLDSRLKSANGELSISSYSIRESTNYHFSVSITVMDTIGIDIIYHADVCDKETIRRLGCHFKNIMEDMIQSPNAAVGQLQMLDEEEKRELVTGFNHTGPSFPNNKTLTDLFDLQVRENPNHPALVGKPTGSKETKQLTYLELNQAANRLAVHLQQKGVQPGGLVALMTGRSIEMIAGMLGILKASGAYVPLNPKAPAARNNFILTDCRIRLLLTTYHSPPVTVEELEIVHLEGSINHTPTVPVQPLNQPGQPAYVIYTSGSTGKPKGVPITHANLSPLLHWGYQFIRLDASDRCAQNLSYYFDWSAWEIFITLTSGATLYTISQDLLSDAESYVDYINENRISVLHITPTHFQALAHCRKTFTHMKHLAIGAEKLTHDMARRGFELVGPHCRVYNMYGPTEATIMSAVLDIERDKMPYYKELSSVPVGGTLGNNALYVLDSHFNPCPVYVTGELYISGGGVAPGYLNNPRLTAGKFITLDSSFGTHRAYKTGDTVRRLPCGAIEFQGRIDHQVKIRGFRIELGEIENQLLEHKEVKEALVMARESKNNEKHLCAYVVPRSPQPAQALKKFLSGKLPDYMVPSFIIPLEKMPLNPNGKVDTKSLPEPGFTGTTPFTAPRTPTEKALAAIWADVLGTEEAVIGIDSDFFQLGGHSLNVTRLAGLIHKKLNTPVSFTDIFVNPTIRLLAKAVSQKDQNRCEPIPRTQDGAEYYPLSSAQERLYVLQQMDPGSTVYNINGVLELTGQPDTGKFQSVFTRLIHRHESLRTSFHMTAGRRAQQIHNTAPFSIEEIYPIGTVKDIKDIITRFIRPFDLSQAPLLRIGFLKLEDEKYLLMVDMHHIISDGTSMGIFIKEFMSLYNGQSLPLPPVRYRDYTQWLNRVKPGDTFKKAEAYWLKQFEGEIPILGLPIDFSRPAVLDFQGAQTRFHLDTEDSAALGVMAQDTGTTMFGVLLSLFTILLSKLGGQEDIVVGTPVEGRLHPDVSQVMGMFVNTLALRNFPYYKKSLEDFTRETGARTAEAFENQEYPFEDLVEKTAVSRDTSHNPLFDVMFAMMNLDIPEIRVPGLHLKSYSYDSRLAKFDFTFICREKNDRLYFTVEYRTRLFRDNTIRRFIDYFKKIVSAAVRDRNQTIGGIEIITDREKQEILHRFNNFEAPFTGGKTIHGLFGEQVQRTPGAIALAGTNRQQISYKKLDEITCSLAGHLVERGAVPGNMIGILAEHSVEMIVGIIAILKTGCAYVPLNPGAPAVRNTYMLKDCNARILLSTIAGELENRSNLDVIDLNECSWNNSPAHTLTHSPAQPAYVIYTSGSTGMPKAVSVTHANFSQLIHWGYRHLDIGVKDRVLRNLSYYFDWSVWEIFIALTTGASLYMPPKEIQLNPGDSVRYMNTRRLTVLHVTPTQYRHIVNSPQDPVALRYLFIGAEKLTCDLVKRSFASLHRECRVFNMYGPTEATIISAVLELHPENPDNYNERSSVPIGRPIGNTRLYILDKHENMCPVNIPGELVISGEGVAAGYVNNPELTAERFIDYRSAKTYKTGDFAKWLPDGTVEFLARIDQQVKIRGFRIELGEIENRLLENEHIHEAVVLAKTSDRGEKYLAAYFAGDSLIPSTELRGFLSRSLPDYMIPSYFVQIDRIPLTANGKVDKNALPEPGTADASVKTILPRSRTEKKLAAIWSEILEIETGQVGVDANFFHMGGHSLTASLLVSKIKETFNVNVPLVEIFSTPVIEGLAQYIESHAEKAAHVPIEPAEIKEHYPLSSAQKRLYVLQRMDLRGTLYNTPFMLALHGPLHIPRLQDAFTQLIHRHESLRTSFHMAGESPVQQIHRSVDFSIETLGAAGPGHIKDTKDIIARFIRPFDLTRAPLLRAGLIETAAREHILIADMHHIICDGVSMKVLMKDFAALYRDETLPPLSVQYKDYVHWQGQREESPEYLRQETYWREQFPGELPVLQLPLDFPRPKVKRFEGKSLRFQITPQQTRQLNDLAIQHGATLYMVLMAAFNVLLSKISGQETLPVGTAVSGRRHPGLEPVIGMFVNTLVLINHPQREKSFTQFLQEVNHTVLHAFENADYPFEKLVESIDTPRDTSRNPLFDVLFDLQPVSARMVRLPGLQVEPVVHDTGIAKFDLMLQAVEDDQQLNFIFEYDTALFEERTVQRFALFYKKILSSVIRQDTVKLSGIRITPGHDKERILGEFNRTQTAYPKDMPIHRLFEEEAKKQPDSPAAVFDREFLTYRELDRRSGAVASYLRAKGLHPGEPVAIMLDTSLQMVAAVLGVLKAGGAYLPIDPAYPRERIDYMLKDSSAAQILTAREIAQSIATAPGPLPVTNDISSAGLAYIIYTSGSTGRPKGVMVEHRSVIRLVKNTNFIDLRPHDRILQTGALEFDASTFEIWGALLNGLTLYLTPKANILNPERLKEIVRENRITTMWLTSPLFNQTAQADADVFYGLRNLLVGGDVLSPAHINLIRQKFPGLRIINGYGPTENTTFSTTFAIDKEYKEKIPIGTPIANSTAYIVDKHRELQPIGIAGELWVGGDGVSRGYMNNPDLTAETFIRLPLNNQLETLYKTGDLARWLPDGNIEFLGRLDHQVKIRGFRIEPREIENRLLENEHVDEAVVIAKTASTGGKFLAAYFTNPSTIPSSELRDFLSRSLPDYMIPSYMIQLDSIPLTANGKVDWRSLPEPGEAVPGSQFRAPRDKVEEKMADLWSLVLGIEKNSLGIDTDFFQIGGHSLNAALLLSKIHKEFNVNMPLTEIFTSPTIAELSHIVKQAAQDTFISIEPVEQKDYYSLSSAQKRLYVLHRIEPRSTGYNIPIILELAGTIEKNRLETTFKELIKRHESFRTSFHLLDDEPVQRVHHDVEFQIQYSTSNEEDIHRFIRPFDLSRAPLLRAVFMETRKKKNLLLLDMHHIVADGSSMNILVNDFSSLYSGNRLPDLRVQYKDFAQWRNSGEQTASIQRQESFWLEQFAGEIPVLNLPLDFPRPAVQNHEGDTVTFELNEKETRALKQLGRENDATLFMVLLGVLNVLLHKLSGQDDIVIGSPMAGRGHPDLEPVIGMFINTLALRNVLPLESDFAGFLKHLRDRTLQAFENRDYPFEKLVEALDVRRDTGRSPLFDVFFALQNMAGSSLIQVPGLTITSRPYEPKTSKFDISLMVTEVDGKLDCAIKYCTKLFKETSIAALTDRLKKIVSTVTGDPGQEIARIDILTEEERTQILFDFNNTKAGYPKEKVIHQIFEENAERTPENVAVVSCADSLTYSRLNRKANQLARLLRKKGLMPGAISAIMANPSAGMLTGMLAIMKAGAAYLPIDPEFPKKRRDYMLADTGASIVLTQTPFMDTLKDSGELINIEDNSIYTGESANLTGVCTPGDVLYTIFTSGTSGKPKGVLVKNENMVNYVSWFSNKTGLTSRDKAMLISSFAYDLGYTAIYTSLSAGGELHLMAKEAYLDPERLLDNIKERKITYLKLTPSLFSVIAGCPKFSKDNLSSLRLVVLGGEAINTRDVEHAYRTCGHLRIMNHYGPTETTIGSVARFIDFSQIEAYHEKPTIGTPISNTVIFILDKYLNPVPIGIAAELCIGGDGVSRGYLNRPELTMEKFVRPAIGTWHTTVYRTGDLAGWLPDGNIEFLGRIDQQVKIRGYRIELGEIEAQLTAHNHIKEAVVIIREDKQDGQPYICGYFVSDRQLSFTPLWEYLVNSLPDYMVPSFLVQMERIPTTPNGKLDKKALPVPETVAGQDYTAPRDNTERELSRIWAGVLSMESEKIGIDDDFFRLGGHSLKAMGMVSRIHKELNVRVPVTRIFQNSTIRSLTDSIKSAGEHTFVSLVKAETREHYPLSPAQRRLYILQQMSPETTGYNMPTIMTMTGKLNRDKLEKTFRLLIERHESLRTAFKMIDSQPVQKIYQNVDFEIQYHDLPCKGIEDPVLDKAIHQFIRPFDLSQCPLLRAALIKTAEQTAILAVDIHHIVSDGVSNTILFNDFMTLYSDEYLPELQLQYKDYSHWLNSPGQEESIKRQEAYWRDRFADEPPTLNMPLDYARPPVRGFEGSVLNFQFDEKDTLALESLAHSKGGTLYMVLLSLYMILLSKLTGQEDVVVGTPVAGRSHADLENIMGVFINTLALRGFPRMEKTFKHFFTEVKELTLDGFAHQDYPYEDLVDIVSVKRDTSRNPLFDTIFSMHNIDSSPLQIPGMSLSPYPYGHRVSKFDLSLYCKETDGKLACALEFNTQLFKTGTIQRFANYFKVIASAIPKDKDSRLAGIDMIPEEEKHRIIYHFNDTSVDYPKEKTIQGIFEEQVERFGDRCAVVSGQLQLTYRELNQRANQLARVLSAKGVEPDTIVPLIVDRSIEMMTGIFGILKAGGAYLPLDPTYPPDRIKYILQDSAASVIVTTEDLEDFAASGYETIDLSSPLLRMTEKQNVDVTRNAAHLAYAIYTSGSTGKPKGVMIQHRALINFIKGITEIIPFGVRDTILSLTTISFDIFGLETILPLTTGSRVIVGNAEEQMDAGETARTIVQKEVTILQVTPSRLLMLVSHEESNSCLKRLEYLLVGGEAFPGQLLQKTRQLGVKKIYNMYGPTETTIWSAVKDVSAGKDLNIGKPIANTGIYILGKGNCIQPIGIAGELCISGDGLARGYVNQPGLTAEMFIRLTIGNQPLTLYRTGDLARLRPDGNIEYIGRKDFQVKIRGFRIELGEIENRLLRHQDIEEAVVLAKQTDSGEYQLYAYFVSGREFSIPELREFLAEELPGYMIPAYFARVDEMPLTPNGKIDRKTLGTYTAEVGTGVEYVAPRNNFEQQISEIWKQELNVDKISIHDNFFELGGNSMHIVKISNRLKELTGENISVMTMFRYPKIHMLSQFLNQEKMETGLSDESIEESVEMMEEAMFMFTGEDDE